jgi:hypothetical protein
MQSAVRSSRTATGRQAYPHEIRIQFKAVAARTYTLQSATANPVSPWQDLVSIPAAAETATVSVAASLPARAEPQFCRVKTP